MVDFPAAGGDAGGFGNNRKLTTCANRLCLAPVKTSSPAYQHSDFHRPDGLLAGQPTARNHCINSPLITSIKEDTFCVLFPISASTPSAGRVEGHRACKNLDAGLLVVMM